LADSERDSSFEEEYEGSDNTPGCHIGLNECPHSCHKTGTDLLSESTGCYLYDKVWLIRMI
jgi:hypothetical protein